MKINIKKTHPDAVIPKYAKSGDAGLDLTVVSRERLADNEHIKYDFGLSFEIPEGYMGLIFPRSSCHKHRQLLSNAVGVVDSGYRGSVSVVMLGTSSFSYDVGERAAQIIIIPHPHIIFVEVDKLSSTERGSCGYGSSGK